MLYFIIMLLIVLLIIIYVISVRNKLVVLKNRVKDEWSQIDVQLKRRFDLIPNIVEIVKGYATHEKETLKSVVEARLKYMNTDSRNKKIEVAEYIDNGVNKIMILAENYPELKASDNFRELQNTLKEVEEKIAFSRQFYNDSVLKYNNQIEMFPSNMIAKIFGFKKQNFFETNNEEKQNIDVKI